MAPRILIGAFALALIIVLVSFGEANPWADSRRLDAVLFPLTDEDRAQIETELQSVVDGLALGVPISVNRPVTGNTIGFFVVKASARSELQIQPGNAKYLPRYDVVLLDEELVRPTAVRLRFSGILLTTPDRRLGSTVSWRRFVLLHELGHRELHRGLLARFGDNKQRELEADEYALHAMRDVFTTSGAGYEGEGTLRTNGTHFDSLDAADQHAVIMSALAQEVAVSLMFGSGHHSTFYRSPSHTDMVTRFRQILLSLGDLSGTANVYRELTFAYFDRLEGTQGNLVREVQLPKPIVSVMRVGDDLSIGLEGGDRLGLPLGTVTTRGPPVAMTAEAGTVSTSQTTPPESADISKTRTVAGLDQAAIDAVKLYYVVPPAAQCYSDQTRGPNERVYVTVWCTHYTSYGTFIDAYLVAFDAPYDTANVVRSYNLPDVLNLKPPPAFDLATVIHDDTPETYLFVDTSTQYRWRSFELSAWQLIDQRPARFIDRQEQITAVVPLGTKLNDWIKIIHPPLLQCSPAGPNISCIQYLDGEYIFDPAEKALDILFYPPGGRRLQIDEGHRVYWTQGGYKLYSVSTDSINSTP